MSTTALRNTLATASAAEAVTAALYTTATDGTTAGTEVVGGTYARLGLVGVEADGGITVLFHRRYPCANFAGLAAILRRFREECEAAHAALRARIPYLDRDRALDGDVRTICELVRQGAFHPAHTA